MEIRIASPDDRDEIISMYVRSQMATGLPDPRQIPKTELGERLYARHAIERYVAVEEGRIVGHGLIEQANSIHEGKWRSALNHPVEPIFEMGGAFVEPKLGRQGIWSALLTHRIEVVRENCAIPVAATWAVNEHVKRKFEIYGGLSAGRQATQNGEVDLFVFPLR